MSVGYMDQPVATAPGSDKQKTGLNRKFCRPPSLVLMKLIRTSLQDRKSQVQIIFHSSFGVRNKFRFVATNFRAWHDLASNQWPMKNVK